MRSVTVRSPAKVNLFLKVLGRRADGYHELVTLFHRISLADTLILRKIARPSFRFMTDHPKLKRKKDNLIFKAYQLLRREASWRGGVEVTLKKKIPVTAGLGGGSSNAASFLFGMNRLFRLHLSKETLLRLGSELGSDIPFFIHQINQAIGTGRGENIKPLRVRAKYWFVLLVPHFEISTHRAYQRLKAPPLTRISRAVTITSAISQASQKGCLVSLLHNDLYAASCRIKPELKRFGTFLKQAGSRHWLMSGSGPAMFGIHKSRREAWHVAQLLRRRRSKADVFVCHTC